MRHLKKNAKASLYFLGYSIAQHIYIKKAESILYKTEIAAKEANDKVALELIKETNSGIKEIKQISTNIQNTLNNNNIYVDETTNEKVLSIVEILQEKYGSFNKIFNNPSSTENLESAKKTIEASNEIVKSTIQTQQELVEILEQILSNGGGTKSSILPDWDYILDSLFEYINSLTLTQELALLHILVLIIIIIIVLNILGVFFGNEVIKYFNLETKFPSLATFFKLRSTLKRYYLMWSILEMFIVCIGSIGFNI